MVSVSSVSAPWCGDIIGTLRVSSVVSAISGLRPLLCVHIAIVSGYQGIRVSYLDWGNL